jgi:hypothetical protein
MRGLGDELVPVKRFELWPRLRRLLRLFSTLVFVSHGGKFATKTAARIGNLKINYRQAETGFADSLLGAAWRLGRIDR